MKPIFQGHHQSGIAHRLAKGETLLETRRVLVLLLKAGTVPVALPADAHQFPACRLELGVEYPYRLLEWPQGGGNGSPVATAVVN